MLDELFIKRIQEAVRSEAERLRDDLRKEIQSLKHGDRISYSLKEAAELTGITYDTLRARCKAGKIPFSQEHENGTILIKREDLERYLDDNKQEVEKTEMKISTR